jgi:hypothetical protein
MWESRAQPHLKTGKSCKAGQSEFRLWMEIKWNWGINVNFLVWWMYYDCARESPIIRSMLKYLGWNSTSAFTLNVYTYIYSYLTEVYTQYKQALVVFFFEVLGFEPKAGTLPFELLQQPNYYILNFPILWKFSWEVERKKDNNIPAYNSYLQITYTLIFFCTFLILACYEY